MYILAGLTKDLSVADYISKAREVALKAFTPSIDISTEKALLEYDWVIKDIEDILKNKLYARVLSDAVTYKILSTAGTVKNIEDGELLAGYFGKNRIKQVISALQSILGAENKYYQAVNTMLGKMESSDLLVFWNIGEEKKDELF